METQLKPGTQLQNGKYVIEAVIGQGGFGITYRASAQTVINGALGSHKTKVTIAIKEFFFADYCTRDVDGLTVLTTATQSGSEMFRRFRQKLIKEAHLLSSLRHPNIVSVIDIFEENGTAYMVMEYIEGQSLSDLIKSSGPLSNEKALKYASEICYAVDNIHRHNVLHLDIKPGNILIDRDDNIKVIDFGISKQYDGSNAETSTTPVGVSRGFAPIEQYSDVSRFTPQTDIYAIGATLYYMLTGKTPTESLLRMTTPLDPLPATVPANIRMAVERAMSLAAHDRFDSAAQFSAALNSQPIPQAEKPTQNFTPKTVVNSAPTEPKTVKSQTAGRTNMKGCAITLIVFFVIFCLSFLFSDNFGCSNRENEDNIVEDSVSVGEVSDIDAAYGDWMWHCEHEQVCESASRYQLDLGEQGEVKTWHCEIYNYGCYPDEAIVATEYEPNCYLKLWFEEGSTMRGELSRLGRTFDLRGGYDGGCIKLFTDSYYADISFYLEMSFNYWQGYYWTGKLVILSSNTDDYSWQAGKYYDFSYQDWETNVK